MPLYSNFSWWSIFTTEGKYKLPSSSLLNETIKILQQLESFKTRKKSVWKAKYFPIIRTKVFVYKVRKIVSAKISNLPFLSNSLHYFFVTVINILCKLSWRKNLNLLKSASFRIRQTILNKTGRITWNINHKFEVLSTFKTFIAKHINIISNCIHISHFNHMRYIT